MKKMSYTFGVLLLMGAHVCRILAQSEELFTKSEEDELEEAQHEEEEYEEEHQEEENQEEEEQEEEEHQEEEIDNEEADNFCDCPSIRRQVCGNDGYTYSSKCIFKCAADKNPNLKIKHVGACDDTVHWLINHRYAPNLSYKY